MMFYLSKMSYLSKSYENFTVNLSGHQIYVVKALYREENMREQKAQLCFSLFNKLKIDKIVENEKKK